MKSPNLISLFLAAVLAMAMAALAALSPVPVADQVLSATAGQTKTVDFDLASSVASVSYSYVVSGLQSGKSAYTRIQLRKSGSTHYSAVVRVTNGGSDYIQLERVVNGATTVVAGNSVTASPIGTTRHLSLAVSDSATGPKLDASAWTTSEASATKLSFTDTSATKITAGNGLGISLYLQGGSTGTTTVTYTGISAAADKGWGNPVFEDTFSGDLSKWNIRNNDYMSWDSSNIVASNAKIVNGNLVLSTNKLATPVVYKDGKQRWYSSAYLDTIGKFSQAYGRWEVRAKLPTIKGQSRGIWPAFWLRPDDGKNGELDIFEAWGTPNSKTFDTSKVSSATLHYVLNDPNKNQQVGWTPTSIDVNDGNFHVWALEFDKDHASFFLDGQNYFTVRSTDKPTLWQDPYGSSKKYNIRLNVAVGSDYWGQPDASTAAHTEYTIDYVRAWTK